MSGSRYSLTGFTLIELLVVLAVVTMLLSIVTPRYIHQSEKASEAVLREQLFTLRAALDLYYSDKGAYPDSLQSLVDGKYLRVVPLDPMTNSNTTWVLKTERMDGSQAIIDVHSGAKGEGLDGSPYLSW